MTQQTPTGAPVPRANSAPTAPFILSLIAGLLILAGAGMMTTFSYGTGYYGMMSGYYGMMQGIGYGGWFYWAAIVGLVSGAAVLIGAVMLYSRPGSTQTWGVLVLVFSILSFFGMGGFFIGAILGVVGGILALALKPEAAP